MVGNHNAVAAALQRLFGIVHMLNPFQDDRPILVFSDKRQILPCVGNAAHDLVQPGPRRAHDIILHLGTGLFFKLCSEDRVAETHLAPDALDEGDIGIVQVGRAPGQRRGVQGDHEHREAILLGPGQERMRNVVIMGPVELVPPLTIPICRGDLFNGARASRAHGIGHSLFCADLGQTRFLVLVENAMDPDRSHDQRMVVLLSKQLDRNIMTVHLLTHAVSGFWDWVVSSLTLRIIRGTPIGVLEREGESMIMTETYNFHCLNAS